MTHINEPDTPELGTMRSSKKSDNEEVGDDVGEEAKVDNIAN